MSGDMYCPECQKTTSGDCGRHGYAIQFGLSDRGTEVAVADASENSRLRFENATLRRRLEALNELLTQEYEKSNGRRDRLKQTEARLVALKSWLWHRPGCMTIARRAPFGPTDWRDGDEAACSCGLAEALGLRP